MNESIGIRVLELYCGIGGMHFSLQSISSEALVVAAVDISPLANSVYQHNFPSTLLLEKGIEGLRFVPHRVIPLRVCMLIAI